MDQTSVPTGSLYFAPGAARQAHSTHPLLVVNTQQEQMRLATPRDECPVAVLAVPLLQFYLKESYVIFRNDGEALERAMKMLDAYCEVECWSIQLLGFKFGEAHKRLVHLPHSL